MKTFFFFFFNHFQLFNLETTHLTTPANSGTAVADTRCQIFSPVAWLRPSVTSVAFWTAPFASFCRHCGNFFVCVVFRATWPPVTSWPQLVPSSFPLTVIRWMHVWKIWTDVISCRPDRQTVGQKILKCVHSLTVIKMWWQTTVGPIMTMSVSRTHSTWDRTSSKITCPQVLHAVIVVSLILDKLPTYT